jgi:hypothetical protein
MRRNRRLLPVPQNEFGFTPDTFNLIVETGVDGDRVAREGAAAERARRIAEKGQVALFRPKSRTEEQSVSGGLKMG